MTDSITVLVKTDFSRVVFLVPLEIKICYPFQLNPGPANMLLRLDLVIKQRKIHHYVTEKMALFCKVWCLRIKN